MPTYYKLSGKFDPSRTILATIVVILLLPLLSFLYNMVNTFIPIIYANVFVAVGYGLLLGYSLRFIAGFGRVRNNQLLFGIGVVIVIIAIFTYWKAFVAYIYGDATVSFSNYVLSLVGDFPQMSFSSAISQINEFGTWGIGASSSSNISGALLWLVWIGEMVIIGGIPLYMLFTRELHPYSEEKERFYDRFQLERGFSPIYAASKTLENLSQDPVQTLQEVPEGRAALYFLVSIYYLPGTKYGYLDIDKVSIGEKGKTESSAIIDNLQLAAADARRVLDSYPHTKAGGISFLH
ncbi:hypothetical protein CEQ90_06055 [Lewinellaceae bacterium SD302]|nr:hypothetical protein CEQ90_06055 [Lewinellaceae bacterium SD302]